MVQLWSAFSCQSLNVSPAGLGGPGEAKAPAGTEFCVLSSGAYLAAFSSWIADEEGVAAGYTLMHGCFAAAVRAVCCLSALSLGTAHTISLILSLLAHRTASAEMRYRHVNARKNFRFQSL